MEHTIILFYKYVTIENPEEFMAQQVILSEKLGLKGRMIIAREGINGTFEGTEENIEKYVKDLKSDSRFSDVEIKKSPGIGNAFPKLSIKVRDEIVSSYLDSSIDPTKDTGTHLSVDELAKWYDEQKDFVVIDMRNDYEFASGHFRNSVPSGMKNFRDLKDVTPKLKKEYKDKTVVTVCTGGVRCEKASAYLKKEGFSDVYQLHNGIHAYMEKYPNKDWEGALYVFDGRVVMRTGDGPPVGLCSHCGGSTEKYFDCAYDLCHVHFLCCEKCADNETTAYCKMSCRIKDAIGWKKIRQKVASL